jgi:hypothetical protein
MRWGLEPAIIGILGIIPVVMLREMKMEILRDTTRKMEIQGDN